MTHYQELYKFSEEGNLDELKNLLGFYTYDTEAITKALWICLSTPHFSLLHYKSASCLIEQKPNLKFHDKSGTSFLMLCSKRCFPDIVNHLISQGASVQTSDFEGKTALHYALETIKSDPVRIVGTLLDAGADPGARDCKQNTPLHYAAKQGFSNSMRALLDKSANINAQNADRDTPLHLAVRFSQKKSVDLLKQAGASTIIPNARNEMPFDNSESKPHWVDSEKKTDLRGKSRNRGNHLRKRGGRSKQEGPQCKFCTGVAEVCLSCGRFEKNQQELQEDLKRERNNRLKLQERYSALVSRVKELETQLSAEKQHAENLKESIEKYKKDIRIRLGGNGFTQGPYSVKLAASNKSPILVPKEHHPPSKSDLEKQISKDLVNFCELLDVWKKKVRNDYEHTIKLISQTVKSEYPNTESYVYGSFATGLILPHSDLDIVITNIQVPSVVALQNLKARVEELTQVESVDAILSATIPVLKICFSLGKSKVNVDLTVQDDNHRGITSAQFVSKLVSRFPTLMPVFLALKQLMFFCNFHEPYKGGLSSYGLFLMTAFYYQEQTAEWRAVIATNKQSLGKIFMDLLYFYAYEFDYSRCIAVNNKDNPNMNEMRKLQVRPT